VISALIPAAGSGERLGRGGPKALVSVRGRAMLSWSVGALDAVDAVGEILVAAPPSELAAFERLRATDHATSKWRRTIPGGATRAASVSTLVAAARGARILVHDAARPCVDARWITSLLDALGDAAAGVPVVPVRDTLKRGENGWVVETVPRESLYAVQTPQLFDTDLLRRAHAAAGDDVPTDDAMLVERLGERVKLLPGRSTNLKVTYPEDLIVAERLLGEE